jgi:hypothetical protein
VSDPVKGVVALARRAEGELPSGLGVRALASLVAGNHGARGGIVWAQGAGGPGVGGLLHAPPSIACRGVGRRVVRFGGWSRGNLVRLGLKKFVKNINK